MSQLGTSRSPCVRNVRSTDERDCHAASFFVVKSERPIKIALLLSTRKIEIQHLRHGFGSKPISKIMSRTKNDSNTDSQTKRDLFAEYLQGTAAKLIKTVREKRNSCRSWDESCYEAE
jgi:hypothetical protein